MECEGIFFNYIIFFVVIDVLFIMFDGIFGKCCYVKILKFGILLDVYLGIVLVDMYFKFLIMVDVERVFGEMGKRNVVFYNVFIIGYGLIGDYENVFKIYMLLRF